MSELAATQVPKPRDEQAFERCCTVLWRCILGDPDVKTHARRGQRQLGVDLLGLRNGDPEQVVGIQCKLKDERKKLTRKEVREEIREALNFRPLLTEYYIVTTAPDDGDLERRALRYSAFLSRNRSKPIKIRVWGWGSLEQEIRKHPSALRAFDPSHTAYTDRIEQTLADLPNAVAAVVHARLSAVNLDSEHSLALASLSSDSRVETPLDREINRYRDMISSDPRTALRLLQDVAASLDPNTSGRLRYRVEANIAACQLELDDSATAATGFINAYVHDPTNPKAVANKALGHLLQEDWAMLRDFARPELAASPDNTILASYYVHALIHDEDVDEPLSLVPVEVRESPEVVRAHIGWLKDRGDPGEWWCAAIEARSAYPDDQGIEEIFANALLDRVARQSEVQLGQTLDADERPDVQTAADIYSRRWTEIAAAQPHGRRASMSVPINLMLAHRLLHQREEAMAVAETALERFSDDHEVMGRIADVFIESGELDRAHALLTQLDIDSQTVMMRFNLATAKEDWLAVVDLVNDHLDLFPMREQGLARAARVVGEARLSPQKDRSAILRAGRSGLENDPRALMVLAQGARLDGDDKLAEELFLAGVNAFEEDDNGFATRVSIAHEGVARGSHRIAADILNGHVDLAHDSDELLLLARSHTFEYPVRQRGVSFFATLPEHIRSLRAYQSLEGIFHINRGAPEEAIAPLEAAYRAEPAMDTLMALVGGYMRTSNRSAIGKLVQDTTLDDHPGSALNRINYCHVLREFGERARSLSLGYRALIDGIEQADVVTKFFGLVLAPESDFSDDFDGVVASGVWVRLVSSHGNSFEALVDEEADRPWGARADSSNAFIAKSLGLKPGNRFEHENVLSQVDTWTIEETKPRWLQAFHELSRTFSQQFPEARGFATLHLGDGDIQPALEYVRRFSEAADARADLYLVQKIPVAFVAGGQSGGTVAFASYLSERNKSLDVCFGSAEERDAALRTIRDNQLRGAVIDALTAWRAAELEVLEILKRQLGAITIPATELDQLKEMADYHQGNSNKEIMKVSYHEGSYYREILTPEQRAEQRRSIRDRIDVIESACCVEPVVIRDDLPEGTEALLTFGSGDLAAPILIADEGRVLLCEDMWMRNLGETLFGLKGVWLQAVLLSAIESRTLSIEEYSDALVLLCHHGHNFTSVGLQNLCSVYKRDESESLVRFKILCRYLGTKDADPSTHLGLGVGFINEIWAKSNSSSQRMQLATGYVLQALLTRNRADDLEDWIEVLFRALKPGPRRYMSGWLKGHFII